MSNVALPPSDNDPNNNAIPPQMQQPPMPLSQWLMEGLPASQQQSAGYDDGSALSAITPTSSGLPQIAQLGPSPFDMSPPAWLPIRQYCILAARATVGDLPALSNDWKRYVLRHNDYDTFTIHHHKALESLLCVQIFAGIPRCIESLYTVYNTELQYIYQPIQRYEKKINTGIKLTPRQQHEFQRLNRIKDLIQRDKLIDVQYAWDSTYEEGNDNRNAQNTKCQCACHNCVCKSNVTNDPHSTSIRNKRGDVTLKAIYRHTYDALAHSLHSYHPALWSSIRQHIYGYQLARTILNIQEIECVAVSALAGMGVTRQLHSHLRGSKFNGVAYELLCSIYHDLRLVYPPRQIENAIKLLNKVYKVNTDNEEDEDVDEDDVRYSAENELSKVKQLEVRDDLRNVVDLKYTIEDASGKYGLGIPSLLTETRSSAPAPPTSKSARSELLSQGNDMPVVDDDDSIENKEAREVGLATIARLTNMMKEREQQIAEVNSQQNQPNTQQNETQSNVTARTSITSKL